MFILTKIKDSIEIKPKNLGKPRLDAVTVEINKLYANKVLHDIGLCVRVFDILEIKNGFVQHSEGGLWVTDEQVKLRVVEGNFTDSNPPRSNPNGKNAGIGAGAGVPGSIMNNGSSNDSNSANHVPPFLLICSMNEDGLGPITWW
ncbi:DNA-directed RNA polymerase III subunit rpc8 [Zancudomyces culisetae]|uniref:DNA-directed RNA polymerase III subunit rpc8 n=1 Tax=Zancudomyces culisetae TaxID=1213189 RepID=A0A1R1PDA6_ZANCU|nr:DNA-directed RNA polymerase III subunit rpc8 [Zancudomyces culisetae]|eukprot:OMH78913.1 DNA-directed RNA polymerase III subunit rpc8 [Zancudomyces culisetae]